MSQSPVSSAVPTVDVNVPRFNQAIVAVATAVAFVLQSPPVIVLMAIVLAVSAYGPPRLAPLSQLYNRIIRPRLQPDGPTEFEPAAPARFAQRIGAGFLAASSVALVSGAAVLGWVLALVVTALAALAATTQICVGCMLYRRLVSS